MASSCRPALCFVLGGLVLSSAAYTQSTGSLVTSAGVNDSAISSTQSTNSSMASSNTNQTAASDEQLSEVVVSARKREENILSVPTSITAFTSTSLDALNIKDTNDYAIQTPNLSFSYGNATLGYGGDRSIAIRGISGPGTTGVYIDDTPVPVTLDPRLVDLERIEVLRGPQGTLFGEGSLGGNVRMITTQPSATDRDVYFEAYAGATKDGPDPDGGLAFAGNQPLAENLVARVSAFVDHTSGFLTRTWPLAPPGTPSSQNDQGATSDWGGSLALLWTPMENLGITARVMFQNTDDYGWPAAFAPLPGFSINSLTVNRDANVQEMTNDRWYLSSLTVNYRASGFTLTSSTSYFSRGIIEIDDSTEGELWALYNLYGGGVFLSFVQPGEGFPTYGDSRQTLTSNETRISFNPWHGLSGIVGVFYSYSNNGQGLVEQSLPGVAATGLTSFAGYCPGTPPCPTYDSNWFYWAINPSTTTSEALFGEMYYDWRMMELTLGLRGYQNKLTASFAAAGAGEEAYVSQNLGSTTQGSVVPKIAISAKFSPDSMVYVSAAEGFRAGGINALLPPLCPDLGALGLTDTSPSTYKSDSVWDYEVGGKSQFAGNRMVVTGSLFYMSWDKIQQSFDVPVCNLPVTLNEGAAIARGGEIEFAGRPVDNLEIRAGYGYDDARFSKQSQPSLPPVGARVGIIPLATWNLSGTFTYPFGGRYTGFITPEVSYVGDSTSYNTSAEAPFTRAGYTIANGSLGVRWDDSEKYHSELALNIQNLTNQRPNFGELGDIGFPARAGVAPNAPLLPRVVTLPPLTAELQYRLRF